MCRIRITNAHGCPENRRGNAARPFGRFIRLCLRDIGEVTLVLSKTGRNVSPGNNKTLGDQSAGCDCETGNLALSIPLGVGASSKGRITQSVKVRPRSKDSGLVAWEAPWREIKTVKPSDNILERRLRNVPGRSVSERRCSLVTRNSGGRDGL